MVVLLPRATGLANNVIALHDLGLLNFISKG